MRILHVADTHLGMRQYGLEARRRDFAAAFAQVVDAAVEARVDAVIHAGDLFDNRFPTTLDLTDVIGQLQRLRQAEVPFLGVVGNHEGKRGTQWLDLFAQLGLAVHLDAQRPFDLGGVPVVGVDFAGRNPEQMPVPKVSGGVLVMHQLLQAEGVSGAGELRLAPLFESGARLVLLGDYHEHRVWRQGKTLVSYAGSTERASAAERARRGVSILALETLALERRELDTRRFVYLGAADAPLASPLAEFEARARELDGAVAVVHAAGAEPTPRKLYAEGLARGALHVVVRRTQAADPDAEAGVAQLDSVEQLDAVLDEAVQRALAATPHAVPDGVDGEAVLALARRADQLVRDPGVPDAQVDGRVTELLAEAKL